MSTQIEQATRTAEANGWTVDKIGPLALFERGSTTLEVHFGRSTGLICDAAVARVGGGIDRILIPARRSDKLAALTDYLTDKDF